MKRTNPTPHRHEMGEIPAAQLQGWFRRANTIVTAPGGQIELTEGQRRIALLFADGTFLVDAENVNSPQLLAIREIARRKGIAIVATHVVPIEILRQLYEEAVMSTSERSFGNEETTPMQREWLALLHEAVSLSASDIHIYVGTYEADIKFRMRGEMRSMRQVTAKYAHELLAAAYNMADAADATYRLFDYQAGRISSHSSPLSKGLQAVRLQLNPMGNGGRYLIARLLYAESRWELRNQMTLESIGLHPQQLRDLTSMRRVPEGINIVSGPTGSGKSTTLKMLLERLYAERHKRINILTIEDPPEYEIYGAAQLPVTNVDDEEERGAAYRKAIVAALRSDPDVIMPGEARDKEVINLVFTAAMTGHQVWTSLHANSGIAIFDRLRDQGVQEYKLTDPALITGLMAQRLIKKVCPTCGLPLETENHKKLEQEFPGFETITEGFHESLRLVNPDGCSECSYGYIGRSALAETICPDQAFLTYLSQGERQKAVRHWQEALFGMTMQEHGWLQMIRGEIDPYDLIDRLGVFRGLDRARKDQLLNMK